MVNRSHLEYTLAGQLHAADLDNIGKGLHHINDSNENQHDRNPQSERKGDHNTAQKQGAGITHKDLGRVKVPDQKAQTAACQCCCQQVHLRVAFQCRNHHKAHACHHRHRGCQTIDAVGEVDRVDCADDDKEHERIIEEAKIKFTCKGNPHHRSRGKQGLSNQISHCDEKLSAGFLPCLEAQIPLFYHLDIVIQKADCRKAQRHQQTAHQIEAAVRPGICQTVTGKLHRNPACCTGNHNADDKH